MFTRLLLFTAVAILIPACFHFKCNRLHSDGLTGIVWERPESAALKRAEAVIEKAATPRAIRLDLQLGVRPGFMAGASSSPLMCVEFQPSWSEDRVAFRATSSSTWDPLALAASSQVLTESQSVSSMQSGLNPADSCGKVPGSLWGLLEALKKHICFDKVAKIGMFSCNNKHKKKSHTASWRPNITDGSRYRLLPNTTLKYPNLDGTLTRGRRGHRRHQEPRRFTTTLENQPDRLHGPALWAQAQPTWANLITVETLGGGGGASGV